MMTEQDKQIAKEALEEYDIDTIKAMKHLYIIKRDYESAAQLRDMEREMLEVHNFKTDLLEWFQKKINRQPDSVFKSLLDVMRFDSTIKKDNVFESVLDHIRENDPKPFQGPSET